MKDDKIECWNCGCEYDEDDIFCPECDADIEPDDIVSDTNTTQVKSKTRSSQPYLAIICSQCGGGIILSNNKMTGSCSHCGTAFIANTEVVKPEIHFGTQTQKSKPYTSQITKQMAGQDVWVKIFTKHTPNCQFCGEPQNLIIGYLFHEGKYLLRCKHCQAEFKCDFTIGGKVKEWTAEIVCCGKVNQGNFEKGFSDIEKLVLDKTKITKEKLKMKWFYKLKRKWRNLIAGIAWTAFFIFAGVLGFLLERYESRFEEGTPLAITFGIVGIMLIVIAIFITSKACNATKRDEKQQEKEP